MNLDDLEDEKCAWCGKEYMPRVWFQKYCSEACRQASRNAFARQEVRARLAVLTCQHCGKPIANAKKGDTRYCSGTCRNAARTVREHGPLTDVRCIDCGESIPGVIRRDTKRCPVCDREEYRRRKREWARAKRAAAQSRT